MVDSAHIDWETRSALDLKKFGVDIYSNHPTTRPWCLGWRIKSGPISVWRLGQPAPQELLGWVAAGGRVVAHNMRFDRTIWNNIAVPLFGWPRLEIEQTDCTMARALAMGLPGALEMAARALGTKVQKDADGHRLMLQMCKPRQIWHPGDKGYADMLACAEAVDGVPYPEYEFYPHDGSVIRWWTDPDKIDRLCAYCHDDIGAEYEVDLGLPQLSEAERQVWILDQKINERGVRVDVAFCERAEKAVAEARTRADLRIWQLTEGAVRRTTEVAKIVAWLNSRGISCESVAKGEIDELLIKADVLSDTAAEEVIELRRAAAKTSNDKYRAMANMAGADGRVRGSLQYHAAATGRWAGRGIQPQNFPRVDADRDMPTVLDVLQQLGRPLPAGAFVDNLEVLTGRPLVSLSKALRAMLIAGEGMKYVGGDFSNIEGRLNAWFAGEEWKLQAFRDYDLILGVDAKGKVIRGGPDLYILAYARSFGVSIEEVDKLMRQIGKVQELALGYQGGVGAFHSMAANYNVHVSDNRAQELVSAWRGANARIVQSWWDLQDAAIAAVGSPRQMFSVLGGKVRYLARDGFLFCCLPSGRVIAYCRPRLVDVTGLNGRKRYQVEYDGLDTQKNRWGPQRLYGGLQCNNVVQGTARDLMVAAMLRAEESGFPVTLTVHDELLCEIPKSETKSNLPDDQILQSIMSEVPRWADGLPLAAAAWEDERYTK